MMRVEPPSLFRVVGWLSLLTLTLLTGCSQDVKRPELSDLEGVTTTAAIVLETENLPVVDRSSARHGIFADPNCRGGRCTSLDANAVNHFVTYQVEVPQARSYTVKVRVKKYINRGAFQLAIAGQPSGSYQGGFNNHGNAQDLYAPAAQYVELTIADVRFGSAGSKQFRFTVTGKHASSSGHTLVLDSITLIATGSSSPAPGVGGWRERILNADGSLNRSEYARVAASYDQTDTLDYRLGPKYSDYHTGSDSFPTLAQRGQNGFDGHYGLYQNPKPYWKDWYAKSGQLLYAPDQSGDYGLARARSGNVWCSSAAPGYLYDFRVSWTPEPLNDSHYSRNPDPGIGRWEVDGPPIGAARGRVGNPLVGVVAFRNGLIGVSGTGNDPNTGGNHWPTVKLPSHRVPTAITVTPGNEFALVTVWNTQTYQGEVAVIALKGAVHAIWPNKWTRHAWGFPSWGSIVDMKLLGYVALPGMAAPSAVAATTDVVFQQSRAKNWNNTLDLNQQAQRDVWYNHTGRREDPTRLDDKGKPIKIDEWVWKRTARAGYAVVASRAENKVAFIDLEPLFAYYRQMYFTTQTRYNQTKTQGNAANQWPFGFTHASAQTPTVSAVVSAPQPTAVAAGYHRPQSANNWRAPGVGVWDNGKFRSSAYVTTMNGELRIYHIGGLNSTAAATPPSLSATVKIGKNPTSLEYGQQVDSDGVANDLIIVSRGDKTVYRVSDHGEVIDTLRDSRLKDPVFAAPNRVGRGCGSVVNLAVMDFDGKQVIQYNSSASGKRHLDAATYRYTYTTPVPGRPFMYTLTEVH